MYGAVSSGRRAWLTSTWSKVSEGRREGVLWALSRGVPYAIAARWAWLLAAPVDGDSDPPDSGCERSDRQVGSQSE